MTNFAIPTLEIDSPFEQQYNRSPQYMLKWRRGQLLVSVSQQVKQPYLPPLESKQRLVECLKRSSVRLVRVDTRLGEAGLKFWADACEQAGKPMFLRVPAEPKLLKKAGVNWWLKRLIEWMIAALLLLVLSPFILALGWLIHSQSSEPIFTQQWCVGKRGKLFRTLKFRTTVDLKTLHQQVTADRRQGNLYKHEDNVYYTPLGRWMRKYRLHKLPQLVNVLRGEMSLVGSHPWILHDAVRVSPDGQGQMNALPGITGVWRMQERAKLLEQDAILHCDLEYLSTWSLRRDLKIMLLSVSRILSGCGAC